MSKTILDEKVVGHTPGQWFADRLSTAVFASDPYRLGHDMKICDIRGWGHLTGTGGGLALPESDAIAIQSANARLIAAAPELLFALKAIMAGFDSGVLCRNTDSDGLSDWAIRATPAVAALGAAAQAIAKAEGRS